MAPRLVELCELLVEEKFGDLAAEVFSALARHGRLVLPQLLQYVPTTASRLRAIVLMLVTHNILLWYQQDENDLPYFQVDWHAAYVLLREGKLIRLVESRHGKTARRLLQDIHVRGKIEVGELEDEQYFDLGSPRDSGIGMMDEQASQEGTAKTSDDDQMTIASFHNTLRTLLEDGFLCKVTAQDHIPAAELEVQLREAVIAADPRTFKEGKTTGPKTAVAYLQAANSVKRKWQDEAEYSSQRDVASQGTIKRAKNSASGSNKRRKMDDNLTDGFHDFHNEEDEDEVVEAVHDPSLRKLPNDMCLRVNFNKCMIALRNEHLEQLAAEYVLPETAAVYGGLLRAAEGKIHSVRGQLRLRNDFSLDDDGEPVDDSDVAVSDNEILDRLDKDLDLASAIKTASAPIDLEDDPPQETTKNGKKRRLKPDDDVDKAEVGIKKEVESDDEDTEPIVNGVESHEHRQKRLTLISAHLDLLGESAKNFIKRNTHRRTSIISFHKLSNSLAEAEIDRMILARCGSVARRVVRVLREKGKLLDTQLAGLCLKRIKDLRVILTQLQGLGFVDVQELPRDNTRQPSRTVYLWQFNELEVRQAFLQQSYHGLSRTLQRKLYEKWRARDILDKAESVDWNLSRLNKPEKELLARWQATEERLDTQVMRLDDVVMALRDFHERDTSLLT